jgi:uncharacterized membrane protein YsdA (DUF1294 family)
MGWMDYASYVIVILTVLLVSNVFLFQYYIEKKTQYKGREFYHESTLLQISLMFLGVFWLFNMSRLKRIRKDSYMLDRYYKLRINVEMFSNFPNIIAGDQAEFKALDRQFKLIAIQKKIKKKKRWLYLG